MDRYGGGVEEGDEDMPDTDPGESFKGWMGRSRVTTGYGGKKGRVGRGA
jgi:hypothetical protein